MCRVWRLVRGAMATIGLLAVACASPARPSPGHSVQVAPAPPSGEPTAGPESPRPRREPETSLIEEGAVGDLRIGKPIPAHHLADDAQARKSYEIRWIADAQPFEAFRVGAERVLAVVHGPFTRWAESNAGELDPTRFVDEAVLDGRKGALVTWIVVDRPGPATRAGIQVGSSHSDLVSAYPSARIDRLPEWFEARLTCQVTVRELRGVAFHLSACGAEPPGPVIRILVSGVEAKKEE